MKLLATQKLTRTCTVQLPDTVCDRLGLAPGDAVEFVEDVQGHVVLRRPRRKLGALEPKLQLHAAPDAPLNSDFLRGFDSTRPVPIDLKP